MFNPQIKINFGTKLFRAANQTFLLVCLFLSLSLSAQAQSPLTALDELEESDRYEKLSELVRSHTLLCGDENEQYLLEATIDLSYRVRDQAVILLSRCKGSSNADAIAQRFVEMLQASDERSRVKDTVISALGGMGKLTNPIKQLLLTYALDSKGAIRREDATTALASFGVADQDVLDAVFVLMEAEGASSRVVSLQCLQLLSSSLNDNPELAETVIERVFEKLPNKKLNFNQHAMILTAELGQHSDKTISLLIEMLDASSYANTETAIALVAMGAPAKRALPSLRQLAAASNGYEQKTVQQAITDIENF